MSTDQKSEQRPRGRGVRGHKLSMSWSGEYGDESTSTGECTCGWSESGSSQNVVHDEYAWHLDREWKKKLADTPTKKIDAFVDICHTRAHQDQPKDPDAYRYAFEAVRAFVAGHVDKAYEILNRSGTSA